MVVADIYGAEVRRRRNNAVLMSLIKAGGAPHADGDCKFYCCLPCRLDLRVVLLAADV